MAGTVSTPTGAVSVNFDSTASGGEFSGVGTHAPAMIPEDARLFRTSSGLKRTRPLAIQPSVVPIHPDPAFSTFVLQRLRLDILRPQSWSNCSDGCHLPCSAPLRHGFGCRTGPNSARTLLGSGLAACSESQ